MKSMAKNMLRTLAVALMIAALILVNVEPAVSEELGDSQVEDTASTESQAEEGETEGTEEPTEGTEGTEAPTEVSELGQPELTAASKPGGKIKLSWEPVDGAQEYVLFRSAKADSGFKKVKSFGAQAVSFVDEGLKVGTVYYYRLTVYAKERELSAESEVVSGRSLKVVKLSEISNISASRKLVLTWEPVQGAAGYKVLRLNAKSGTYKEIAEVKAPKTTYTDKKRTGGTVYSYKVCAVDEAGGRGAYSKPMSQMAIDANKKMIALTYDDGPSIHTPIVLDALEKYDAHATFFVIGYSVTDKNRNTLNREIALGCEIGNHTYNHEMLKTISAKEIKATLDRVNTAVKKQTGVDIRVMRPPGGGQNETVRAAVGMPVIIWSIDTLDWKTRDTQATIKCVKKEAYDGAIVLMHDLHKPTADAAEEIIRYLKAEGYQMVTISEMAAYRGGMEAGKSYTQFKK